MHAFAQDLTVYKHVHLIRAGRATRQYGDPWEYCMVCVSQDGHTALLMGFKSDPNFSRAVSTAAMLAVRGLGYKRVQWERITQRGNHDVDLPLKSGSGAP